MSLFKIKQQAESQNAAKIEKIKVKAKYVKLISNMYYGHADWAITIADADEAKRLFDEICDNIGRDYILQLNEMGENKTTDTCINLKFYARAFMDDTTMEVFKEAE